MKSKAFIVSAALALQALCASAELKDIQFERVWEGRSILDAALPFPEGVTFVPGAEYRAEVKSLPAGMRIENAAGDVMMRFAAPTNVTPPFTMHVAVTGANSPAVFATKDGKTTLACIARKPGGFDPRRQEYTRSLSVKPEGGAGAVESRLSPGVGQADVRFVTRGREGRPYIENGRLYFTFSARFYASVTGVGSLDAVHPERGVRFEGAILYDYGDGLFRNDLAPHIFFDDEAGEWRGWACNFSTGSDKLGGRAKGGVNAVWSKTSPLHGLAIMKAKSLGLENMHEDPCGVWDPDAKKWRVFVCRFVKGIKAVMLESDRWDGGYKEIAGPVAHDSTGTTIAWAGGTRYCLSGSSDLAYYIYSYPELKMLGKLQMSPTPWGSASGRPHGRGWPAFAELPDGYPHKYILLTMDRVNFPGMPKPNWTYGGLQIYAPADFAGTESCRPPADAVVLFDGTQGSFDANWTDMNGRKAKWRCVDGTIEATRAAGDIRTRREFGDVQLHIEWQVPADLPPYDMNSGNSGVFLMGLYELQVFESYETDPADMKHPFYADGQAAAIYGQNPPLVNPTRRRGEWQTYDIVFRRPLFDGATCIRPAVITAFLNGVLVQDGWKLEGPTGHLRRTRQTKPPSEKGPVKLQQHLCPVRFRNVWVRELPEGLKSRKESISSKERYNEKAAEHED